MNFQIDLLGFINQRLINTKRLQSYTSNDITINDVRLILGRSYKQNFIKSISVN